MCYKCDVCTDTVGKRKVRKVWPIYRLLPTKQIIRELAVCVPCWVDLSHGSLPAALREAHLAKRGLAQPKPPAPAPVIKQPQYKPIRLVIGKE
jgi:hypothetical protein